MSFILLTKKSDGNIDQCGAETTTPEGEMTTQCDGSKVGYHLEKGSHDSFLIVTANSRSSRLPLVTKPGEETVFLYTNGSVISLDQEDANTQAAARKFLTQLRQTKTTTGPEYDIGVGVASQGVAPPEVFTGDTIAPPPPIIEVQPSPEREPTPPAKDCSQAKDIKEFKKCSNTPAPHPAATATTTSRGETIRQKLPSSSQKPMVDFYFSMRWQDPNDPRLHHGFTIDAHGVAPLVDDYWMLGVHALYSGETKTAFPWFRVGWDVGLGYRHSEYGFGITRDQGDVTAGLPLVFIPHPHVRVKLEPVRGTFSFGKDKESLDFNYTPGASAAITWGGDRTDPSKAQIARRHVEDLIEKQTDAAAETKRIFTGIEGQITQEKDKSSPDVTLLANRLKETYEKLRGIDRALTTLSERIDVIRTGEAAFDIINYKTRLETLSKTPTPAPVSTPSPQAKAAVKIIRDKLQELYTLVDVTEPKETAPKELDELIDRINNKLLDLFSLSDGDNHFLQALGLTREILGQTKIVKDTTSPDLAEFKEANAVEIQFLTTEKNIKGYFEGFFSSRVQIAVALALNKQNKEINLRESLDNILKQIGSIDQKHAEELVRTTTLLGKRMEVALKAIGTGEDYDKLQALVVVCNRLREAAQKRIPDSLGQNIEAEAVAATEKAKQDIGDSLRAIVKAIVAEINPRGDRVKQIMEAIAQEKSVRKITDCLSLLDQETTKISANLAIIKPYLRQFPNNPSIKALAEWPSYFPQTLGAIRAALVKKKTELTPGTKDEVKPAEAGATPNAERLAGIERTIKEFDRAWKHIVFSLGIAVSPQRANENDLNQLGTAIQGIKDKNGITEPNEGLQAKIGPQLDKIDEAIKLLDAAQKEFPGNKAIEGKYQRALRIQGLLKQVPGLLATRVTKIEEEATASRAEAERAAQAEAATRRVALGQAQAAVHAAVGEVTAQLKGIASSILKDDKIPATPDYIFSVELDLTRKISSSENIAELGEILGKIVAARISIQSQKATIDGAARTYPSDAVIEGQAKLPGNALSLLERLEKKVTDRKAALEHKAADTAATTIRNNRTEANSLASGMDIRVGNYRQELEIQPGTELTDALLDEAFEKKFPKAKENELKGFTTGLAAALADFSDTKLKRLGELQAGGDQTINAAAIKAGQTYTDLQLIHSAAERRLKVIAAEAAPEAVTTDTSDLGRDIRTVVTALRNNHLSKTTGDNNPVTTAIQFQQGIPTKKNELKKRLQPILNSLKSPEVGKAIQGIVVVTSDLGAIGNIKAIFTEAGVAERALVVKLDTSLTQQTTNAPDKEFIYVHFFTAHGNISVDSAKTGPGTTALLAETKRLHNEWFPEELPELKIKPGTPDIAPPEDPRGAEPTTKKSVPDILATIASDPDFGKITHDFFKPVERYQNAKAKLERSLVTKFGEGVIPFFTGLKVVSSGTTMGIPHVDTLLKIVQAHVPDAEGILVLVHESTPGNSALGDLQPNGTFVKIAKSYFERDFKKSSLKLDVLGVGRIVLGEKQERTTRYQVVIIRRGTDMGAVKTFIQDFANKTSGVMDKIPSNYGH